MRREQIAHQRQTHGRKALAVLPIHYPKELLTALDLLAVELWGPPGPPRGEEARRIQSYVCAVARNAFAFLAGGHAGCVDGVLFPHTCDSIQGLGTLCIDGGGWKGPAFTFLHPRGEPRESARRFLDAELHRLAAALEPFSGVTLTPERLGAALRLHAEVDGARPSQTRSHGASSPPGTGQPRHAPPALPTRRPAWPGSARCESARGHAASSSRS
jgi:benzoyl-CoA reductase/2-hydroxyglutaryl-CoA dehydratase subunit BcrC/BadD/HgdB